VPNSIEMDDGRFQIDLQGEHDYTLTVAINVLDGKVSLMSAAPMTPPCKNGRSNPFRAEWPKPKLEEVSQGGQYKLILEAATYRDTHQSSACVSEPSSIPANARHLELSVTSVPEGAEIWIRDEKLGNNTNAVVSVPYTYDVPITVVVAKPGYAVCARTLVP